MKAVYEINRLLFSTMTNRVFFCPRVRVLDNGIRKAIGVKYDVTNDIQPYLLKRYREENLVVRMENTTPGRAALLAKGKKKVGKKK